MNFKAVKRMKSYMKENKLTALKFSKMLGVSPSYLSRILNFKRGLTDDFVSKLVRTTNLDNEFWTGHKTELNTDEINKFISLHRDELENLNLTGLPTTVQDLLNIISGNKIKKAA